MFCWSEPVDDDNQATSQLKWQLETSKSLLQKYSGKLDASVARETELKGEVARLQGELKQMIRDGGSGASPTSGSRMPKDFKEQLEQKEKTITTLTLSYRAEKLKSATAEKLRDSAHSKYDEEKKKLEEEKELSERLKKTIESQKVELRRLGIQLDQAKASQEYAEDELEAVKARGTNALQEAAKALADKRALQEERDRLAKELRASKLEARMAKTALEDGQMSAAQAEDSEIMIAELQAKLAAAEEQLYTERQRTRKLQRSMSPSKPRSQKSGLSADVESSPIQADVWDPDS
mmetsp:Transcript_16667/g.36845  ORF Transcript_16667/g.36845 Transcript_16667/m.36845 type:complete len:293 (-) Transcript_16667:120-998(-)